MKLFNKVKSAFDLDQNPTKSDSSSTPTREEYRKEQEAIANDDLTAIPHEFRDVRLRDSVIQAMTEIRNECFPDKVEALVIDSSDQFVSELTLKAVAPQGLTVTFKALAHDLEEAQKDIGLKRFIKEKLSQKIFSVIGNLEWQESNMPTFITNYNLQSNDNLSYFHINEDLLTTAGFNMYFSQRLVGYPATNSSTINTFSKKDLAVVKEVNNNLQKYLNLKSILPIKCIVPVSNGFFVEVISLQLKNGKGKFQFNIFPEQNAVDRELKAQAYYSSLLDAINEDLDITPRKASVRFHNGLKGLSIEEIRKELNQLTDLIKSLPDDYSELSE